MSQRRLVGAMALMLGLVGNRAVAQVPFSDSLVQAPSLTPPERGSLAGQYAETAIGPSDVVRGAFTLPSPFALPTERGTPGAAPFPSYSPEAGLSEWGLGWQPATLSLQRWRVAGDIDCASDDLQSPWGWLQRGTDGAWYAHGMRSTVRVEPSGTGYVAWLGDGTRWTFEPRVPAPCGTYAWYVTSIVTATGRVTRFEYLINSSGRPFLSRVSYGAAPGLPFQHELELQYEAISPTFAEYRSGAALVLDRRVRTLVLRSLVSGSMTERWRYTNTYAGEGLGPGFLLVQVQKTFASGASEPALTYDYATAREQLPAVSFRLVPKLDGVLGAYGQTAFQANRATVLDADRDGRPDLEYAADGALLLQQDDGFAIRPLRPPGAETLAACRPPTSQSNPPRTIAELSASTPDAQVLNLLDGSTSTALTICDRDGTPLYRQTLAAGWKLGPNVRLVDVNRDQQPDLVRVGYGSYSVLPNQSSSAGFAFGSPITGTLTPAVSPTATWVLDVNGDGIPDLLARMSTGLIAWMGKGRYQFDRQGVTLQLFSASGALITNLGQYELTFLDANKDGLTDLVLARNGIAGLFVNTGSRFQQASVPGLSFADASATRVVLADLAGSGEAELAVVKGGHAYSLALTAPGTGLLRKVDDGKGTALWFEYRRADATPGARARQSVLSRLTVHASGYDDTSYDYGYADPTLHSRGRFLVGYGEVQRTEPLGSTWARFLNSDDYAGVMSESRTLDDLNPGLEKYAVASYPDHLDRFRGIPWIRIAAEETGWRAVDGSGLRVFESTSYVQYDRDEICPSIVQKQTRWGTLTVEKHFTTPAGLAHGLPCIADTVVTDGAHGVRDLDFTYTGLLEYDDAGQLRRLSSLGADGQLVLQEVTYDTVGRVQAVSAPGQGTTIATYDPSTGLLTSVTTPAGVVVTAVERDPLTDALLTLRTDRGPLRYEQRFRYDGLERLQLGWDSIGAGGPFNPDVTYAYRYATEGQPASVLRTLLVDTASSSVQTSVDLLTARGESIGTATQIPEGWAFRTLTRRAPTRGEATGYVRPTLSGANDPGQLSLEELFSGAEWVVDRVAGPFGAGTTTTRLHRNVSQHVRESLGIDDGQLIRNARENGRYDQTRAYDAGDRALAFWNEAGTEWSYAYDALGRLREVRLPDGHRHRLAFDTHARVSSVQRDGIGSIEYAYDRASGLLSEKHFRGSTGIERRVVRISRDATGRVTEELHTSDTSETRSFRFFYDGATAASPTARGPLGFLTGVCGQGFEKTFSYRADGKVDTRTLSLASGWRRLVTSFAYDEAGNVQTVSTIVKDASGVVIASSSATAGYDSYGRQSSTDLGATTLATYGYDTDGLLHTATLNGGDTLALEHDELTRSLVGSSQVSRGTRSSVTRRLNERALVDTDVLSVGALSLSRSYQHLPERFLASATDARASSVYGYAPDGLPTSVVENGVAVQVTTSRDDLGRVVVRDDLTLSYGPDGQLASATRGTRTWTFLYDEAGHRLLKLASGVPVAAYTDDGLVDAAGLTQPFKIGSRAVGLLVNGAYEPRATDLLGSILADAGGQPRIASPYGSRSLDGHPDRAAALEYAEKGFDADLGLIRMGVRDYDPEQGVFLTPDPLYLEAPDRCLGDALGCGLFGYAAANPLLFVDPSGEGPEIPDGLVPNPMTQFAQMLSNMFTTVFGGHTAVRGSRPEDIEWVPPNPFRGASGMYGGAVRAITFRLYPMDPDADAFGRSGAEMGASFVPFADPAMKMVTGKTVTGLEASRTEAAVQFVLDVPVALEAVGVLGKLARGPKATLELARQIEQADPARWRRTIVLLETEEGPTLVAGGASDLSPAQKALAQKLGLTVVPDARGVHGELTAILGAREMGLTPTGGISTNIICPECRWGICQAGGSTTGKRTFILTQ